VISSEGLTGQSSCASISHAGYAKAEPDVVLALLLTLPPTLNPLLIALLATCREEDKKMVPGVLQKVCRWGVYQYGSSQVQVPSVTAEES
jgi:hypothetical protein